MHRAVFASFRCLRQTCAGLAEFTVDGFPSIKTVAALVQKAITR